MAAAGLDLDTILLEDKELKHILEDNKVTELYDPLKENNITCADLKSIKESEIDECAGSCGLNFKQKIKFRTLIRAIQTPTYDDEITICLIGDSQVGKTCLMERYRDDTFRENPAYTFGTADYTVYRKVNDKTIKITLWDTAGQERYQSMCVSTYKKADAILLCFAGDNAQSFINLDKWRKQIEENAPDHVSVLLVECKIDVTKKYTFPRDFIIRAEWKKYKATFCQCSAKTGDNVRNVFEMAADMVLSHPNRAVKRNGVDVEKQVAQESDKFFGCFSSESFVLVYPDYRRKKISEINYANDKILSYDNMNKQFIWDILLVKYHHEKEDKLNEKLIKMVEIQLENNYDLTMTPNHLLFVNQEGLKRMDDVAIGDKLNHFHDGMVKVIDIKTVWKYPRNLLTYSGNVVVNGVAISSFTESLWGESKYFGESLRFVMSRCHQYKIWRYPVYYMTKFWREQLSVNIKQQIENYRMF